LKTAIPALLTSASMRPKAVPIRAVADATAAGSATSHSIARQSAHERLSSPPSMSSAATR
jgi:hypothetical protein